MIKEYFKEKLKTKKSTNKHLKSIDESLKEIKNQLDRYEYLQEQTNKYKTKVKTEHDKYNQLLFDSTSQIDELIKERNSLAKKNKKLEKELKNVQV